jgi:hypothetical protein
LFFGKQSLKMKILNNKKALTSIIFMCVFSSTIAFGFLFDQGNTQPEKNKEKKQTTAVESELVSIAEDNLKSEYDSLVSGDSDEPLTKNPKAKKVNQKTGEKHGKRRLKAKLRHNALKSQKIFYTSYTLNMDVKDLQISSNSATLKVDANVHFPISIDGKQIDQEYATVDKYIFTYELQNNQWILTDSKKLDDLDENLATSTDAKPEMRPPASIPELEQVKPTEPGADKSGKSSQTNIYNNKELFASSTPLNYSTYIPSPYVINKNNTNSVNMPTQIIQGLQKSPFRLALTSINAQEIVNYAHVYSGNYDSHAQLNRGTNPAWSFYGGVGGDCTNFVSQALKFGGWSNAPGLWNTSLGWWGYNKTECTGITPCQSYSWTGADYFYDFVQKNSGRAYLVTTFGELQPGDIIQVNYPPVSGVQDYPMEHSMIVTHKNPKSTSGIAGYYELMVAYHSSNTLDKPFTDFYNAHPNTNGYKYYAWRIRSSY